MTKLLIIFCDTLVRVLVNAGGSQECISIGNGLMPSLTLGCGIFGGTSTTDTAP